MEHNKNPAEKQLLTVAELSELTGLSKFTIRKFISEGRFSVIKSGRKFYISLDNFLRFTKGEK